MPPCRLIGPFATKSRRMGRRVLFGGEPPQDRRKRGEENNRHPNEPGRATIFAAYDAIEEREPGQSESRCETRYERLLLLDPSLRCEPWTQRNTKYESSGPADPSGVGWHPWVSAQL